jgi:hypothetical protein
VVHPRSDIEADDAAVGVGCSGEGSEAFAGGGADLQDAFSGLGCEEALAGRSGVTFEAPFDASVARLRRS